MQDVGCGLRRTPLPGTWVNKGKKKGLGCYSLNDGPTSKVAPRTVLQLRNSGALGPGVFEYLRDSLIGCVQDKHLELTILQYLEADSGNKHRSSGALDKHYFGPLELDPWSAENMLECASHNPRQRRAQATSLVV